ncbi:MAG: hypothetical protein GX557_12370 [Chloroflexi bacterium]|nr:hypothetical protein [Chloroflexota bacterium]
MSISLAHGGIARGRSDAGPGGQAEFALAVGGAIVLYAASGGGWRAAPWDRTQPLSLNPWASLLAIGLLALSVLQRVRRTGRVWSWAPTDVALFVFVLSAGVSAALAAERAGALALLGFTLGAVGLYWAVRGQDSRTQTLAVLACWALFGAAYSIAFLASADWEPYSDKAPLVGAWAQALRAAMPPAFGPFVNPNDAGGIVLFALPACLPLLGQTREHLGARRTVWRALWGLAAALMLLAWLFSLSRGAWAALLGAVVLWAFWRLAGRAVARRFADARSIWRRQVGVTLGVAGACALLAMAIALLAGDRLPGAATLANRIALWRGGLLLARDYPVIGAGLGSFPLHYSLYALLIHVGFVYSSHNLAIDVLVAQGAVGLAAGAVFVLGTLSRGVRALRRTGDNRLARQTLEACLVALLAVLLHGLVQDVYYASPALMLLGLPLGLIGATYDQLPHRAACPPTPTEPSSAPPRTRPHGALTAALLLALLGGAVWQRSTLIAAWHTNSGALIQSRSELRAYDPEHFAELPLEAVRARADLSRAERHYERAIAAVPTSAGARLRLAGIRLAQRDYAAALTHTQAVWGAGYHDSVARLLYGDALVAAGQVERAADVVRGVSFTEERLLGQATDRYALAGDVQRAAQAWATVLLLDPDNAAAATNLAEAEALLADGE